MAGYNEYHNNACGSSLEWLFDAGVVSECYRVKEPALPLSYNREFGVFKLFMRDTGLLVSMMEPETVPPLIEGDNMVNVAGCGCISRRGERWR